MNYTTELGFDLEVREELESGQIMGSVAWAIDVDAYEASLDLSLLEEFKLRKDWASGEAWSFHLIETIFKTLKPGAGVVLNSSTGKDSTLMTAIYLQVAEAWAAQGKRVPETVIAVANSAAEFPMMASRLSRQVDALNAYCQKKNLPVEAFVETARAKNRLFAEIIGNGRPLPALVTGSAANASGSASTSWCMDRVKGGPLNAISKRISAKFTRFINLIGVREGESTSRDAKIEKYTEGLPHGLTRLNGTGLAQYPILDWSTELVEAFLRTDETPWDFGSSQNLASIYYSVSNGGKENVSECGLKATRDEGVSNKCSGFDGARMGCFMCVKSVNRSLSNIAKHDSRELRSLGKSPANAKHRWLRGFHKYLIGLHRRYEIATSKDPISVKVGGKKVKVRSILASMGKNTNTLFAKNLAFEERARLLLLLFRAELESGFKLIEEEEIDSIALYWKKAGYYHINPWRIREDAKKWKATGKPILYFEHATDFMDQTDIADGLASAAYFHVEDEAIEQNFQPLKLLHLLSLRSHGMPLLPKPRAYIFHRRERANNEALVMVTDMPSVIGAKTGTNLLNGIAPFAWVLRGSRELTEWEMTLFKTLGRNFFYSHLAEETNAAIKSYLEIEEGAFTAPHSKGRGARHGFFPHRNWIEIPNPSAAFRETILLNAHSVRHGGHDQEPLDAHWQISESVADLRGKVTFGDLKELIPVVRELADNADYIEDISDSLAYELESLVDGRWDLLESADLKQTAEMKEFQGALSDFAKRRNIIGRTLDLFNRNQVLLSIVIDAVIEGHANGALINQVAYITRTQRYDPKYAEELMANLVRLLDLAPAANSFREKVA